MVTACENPRNSRINYQLSLYSWIFDSSTKSKTTNIHLRKLNMEPQNGLGLFHRFSFCQDFQVAFSGRLIRLPETNSKFGPENQCLERWNVWKFPCWDPAYFQRCQCSHEHFVPTKESQTLQSLSTSHPAGCVVSGFGSPVVKTRRGWTVVSGLLGAEKSGGGQVFDIGSPQVMGNLKIMWNPLMKGRSKLVIHD